MTTVKLLVSSILISALCDIATSRIWLDSVDDCEQNVHYPCRSIATLKKKGDLEYMNVTMVFDIPYGLNQRVELEMGYLDSDGKQKTIFRIKRPLCDFFNKDLGQFWFDIQRECGMEPKLCPIRPGRYHLTNYELNYNKMNLIAFPRGKLGFIFRIIEYGTNKIISCTKSVVTSE